VVLKEKLGAFSTEVEAFYAMFCHQQQRLFHAHKQSVYHIFDGFFLPEA